MKQRSKGMGTRFDGPAAVIDAMRDSAPGLGVFLKYSRWCHKCGKDKPAKGARQIRPGVFRCADCAAIAAPTNPMEDGHAIEK